MLNGPVAGSCTSGYPVWCSCLIPVAVEAEDESGAVADGIGLVSPTAA